MTKEEARKAIAEKLDQVDALYKECVALADEHSVPFSTSVAGVYGTGAYYDPDWNDSGCSYGDDGGSWHASSQSC